ncbi:hypothetical protein HZA33_01905 [Candidatus Pacearchaeota archaeon]|nr:hypothetical protein [Candidatus Pacearchaeota archaeon]
MKKFELKEFNGKMGEIDRDWYDFSPFECMDCKNSEGFQTKIFLINKIPKSKDEESELKRILLERGIKEYGIFSSNKPLILSAICQKCGSDNIFWDFKKK